MRARSTRFLSLCLATSAACLAISGCNGSIGTSGAQGSGTGGTGVGTGTGGTGTTGAAGTGIVTLPNSALESGSVLRLANYEFTNSIHDLLGITPNVPLEPDAPSTGDFRIGGPAGDNTVSTYHAAAMTLAAQALKTLATIEPCYGTATTAATQATCASTIASD